MRQRIDTVRIGDDMADRKMTPEELALCRDREHTEAHLLDLIEEDPEWVSKYMFGMIDFLHSAAEQTQDLGVVVLAHSVWLGWETAQRLYKERQERDGTTET